MTVGRGTLGQGFIILLISPSYNKKVAWSISDGNVEALGPGREGTYLGCLFEMLDAVPVDIVMRSDRFSELGADDHTGSFGSGTTGKEHDTGPGVREGGLDIS